MAHQQIAILQYEVAKLEAENARLKEELEREWLRLACCGVAALGYFEGCNEEYRSASLNDVLRLREQLAAAQKDGERYRWLRNNEYADVRIIYIGKRTGAALDMEIDAAIAAEKGEKK